MRRRARVDANQTMVVAEFRRLKCVVQHLSSVGQGVPDLLIRLPNGTLILVEVKDGNKPPSQRKLTPDESRWMRQWDVHVIESIEQVNELVERLCK